MKVAVIGLGSMGKRRIRLMKAMKLSLNIVGVDNNKERCKQVKEEYAIKCYNTVEEVIKKEALDCVFVCTSPLAHGDIIHYFLNMGCHVFTEINLVSNRYQENILLAKEKGVVLFLSSTPLYRDEMKKIKSLVENNVKPVSYLYHVGQYLPDWHPWESFSEFFVSNKKTNGCREIFAIELPWMIKTFGEINEIHTLVNQLTSLKIDYPDTYLVQISHVSGTKGIIAVDVVCRKPVRKLEVYNEDLYIEWEGTPQTLRNMNMQIGKMETLDCGTYYNEEGYSEFVNEYAYINELKEFFAVINGKTPQYTMEEDEKTLEYIDIIEKSI